MLALIGLAVGATALVLVGLALTKSDTFRVVRSATIKAPPAKIYPLIADFRQWRAWSPWERLDPALKRAYEGPPTGKGAVYAWDGAGKVGAGRMEITESVPPASVAIDLRFIKPWEGRSKALFTLAPDGDGTTVTWSMNGPNPFVAKLMQVFFDSEQMVGQDFADGLANLKAAAEQ